MDGRIKSVTLQYVEEGGMVLESEKIDSLPEFMEKQVMQDISEEEQTLLDEIQSLLSDKTQIEESESEAESENEEKTRTRLTADSMPFDKFLDFMEIF